jgi:hypothetical protein
LSQKTNKAKNLCYYTNYILRSLLERKHCKNIICSLFNQFYGKKKKVREPGSNSSVQHSPVAYWHTIQKTSTALNILVTSLRATCSGVDFLATKNNSKNLSSLTSLGSQISIDPVSGIISVPHLYVIGREICLEGRLGQKLF